jgi:hypothetical protein
MGYTVSAAIKFTALNNVEKEYRIANPYSSGALLDDVSLRDTFDIKGIGRLRVSTITTMPIDMTPTDHRLWTQKLIFHCKLVVNPSKPLMLPAPANPSVLDPDLPFSFD